MVSLGSIIGSGWLLGALNAAERAGPASVLSWLLAAGNAVAPGPGVRGARRDVSGGRRSRAISLLLARAHRRIHGRMGVVAAGRVHRAHRGAGDHHVRQQRRLGQSALQHDLPGRRESRHPQQHRAHRRAGPDGAVHRDESGGRQVRVSDSNVIVSHLEDGRAGAGDRRRGRAAVQSVELPRRRRGSCRSAFTACSPP